MYPSFYISICLSVYLCAHLSTSSWTHFSCSVLRAEFKVSMAAGQLGYLLATSPKQSKVEADLSADHGLIAELLQVSYDNHDSWGILGMGYCLYKGGCGGGIDRNITRSVSTQMKMSTSTAAPSTANLLKPTIISALICCTVCVLCSVVVFVHLVFVQSTGVLPACA